MHMILLENDLDMIYVAISLDMGTITKFDN